MLTRFQILVGLYHWLTCIFIIGLVCSQLLGAVWDSTTTQEYVLYGRSPLLGPMQIVGTNDIPYADRAIACVGKGRFYEPKLVSSLLAAPGESAVLEDSTGTALTGYRLKQRRSGSVSDALDSTAYPLYAKSCELIADTIENIFEGCTALGYSNLTRDNLRVVDDWDSKNLYKLPHTLPILIMPYWDNALYARHAIPTWGGDACVFRLEGAYNGEEGIASFLGVNQSVRHERTLQWLGRPGGYWKNGWYEDTEGVRWYSDVASSAEGAPYYMMYRMFDMQSGLEIDCSSPNNCEATATSEDWGDKFTSSTRSYDFNSVYIANATEYGLFIYEAYGARTVHSVFDWETLLSNIYTVWILHRWMLANVLVLASAFRGKSQRSGSAICCVSRSRSFAVLPIVSLPRLKMTLAAFWTVGCRFEGQQSALADAWFAIYPAITHLVLIYFSILNSLGKALRCRVSDALFTPTIVALCLLHYFRQPLAASGWLSGVDGRAATLVFSDEAKQIQLLDYFTTDIAWRMNGRVTLVFTAKLCILAVNIVPLFLARPFPISSRDADRNLRGIEEAIALCVKEVGGLGDSPPYILTMVEELQRRVSTRSYLSSIALNGNDGLVNQNQSSDKLTANRRKQQLVLPNTRSRSSNGSHATANRGQREVVLVNSYELIRLGYLVFGDIYLTTFQEWGRLTAMTPFRAFFHLWNHRVLVWTLRPLATNDDAEVAGGRALESTEPEMWRLDDPRLQQVRWWQVSACNIQC